MTEHKPEEIRQSVVVENGSASGWAIPISVVIASLIISATSFYNSGRIVEKLDVLTVKTDSSQNTTQTAAQKLKIDIKDTVPFLGNKDAKVVLVEYADYQCPYCEKWYKEVWPTLKAQYIDTGKIKFVYQDFAFLGPDSMSASEAAHCAMDQGKFWQYHEYLFKNQGQENSGWANIDKQKQIAKTVGLNTSQFNSCLDTHKHQNDVLAETEAGRNYQVSATPTLLVLKSSDMTLDTGVLGPALAQKQNIIQMPNKNVFIVGAQPANVFAQYIDSLLQ